MRSRASFRLGTALSQALAFLPRAWVGAGLALLLLWGAAAGGAYAVATYDIPYLCLIAVAVVSLFALVALGALYRTALFGKEAAREGRGPGGLQFGAPELRLLAATVIAAIFIALVAGAAFVVFAIGLKIYGMDLADRSPTFNAVATLAGLALVLFVIMKFSLIHAANIAQRRLVTLNALGLTPGHTGKLFLGTAVLAVPFAVACAVLLYLFAPDMLTAEGAPYPLHPRTNLFLYGGMTFLVVGVLLPLLTGFLASAYRQISESR